MLPPYDVRIHQYIDREKMRLVTALMDDRGMPFREVCLNDIWASPQSNTYVQSVCTYKNKAVINTVLFFVWLWS